MKGRRPRHSDGRAVRLPWGEEPSFYSRSFDRLCPADTGHMFVYVGPWPLAPGPAPGRRRHVCIPEREDLGAGA